MTNDMIIFNVDLFQNFMYNNDILYKILSSIFEGENVKSFSKVTPPKVKPLNIADNEAIFQYFFITFFVPNCECRDRSFFL